MDQPKMPPVKPVLDPTKECQEINAYVVVWGLFYAVLFTLAVGYLCLKIGQTVDAFAPVSVLAMGTALMLHRSNAFAETVHIQAIASAGTNILAGAMFILPAIYILNIPGLAYWQMVIPIILGGLLGVFLTVVFRKYFCVEMHDCYPFPSGRAAAEVLSSNEGSKAKLMVFSGLVGIIYDFILNTMGWWQEVIDTTTFKWGQFVEHSLKLNMSLDTDIALLGIGYFTGIRYAAIIAAGSFFASFVAIPVVYYLGGDHHMVVKGQEMLLADAPVHAVFLAYVRHIGIGMLAMAGVIGLLSMAKVVKGVVVNAMKDIFTSGASAQVSIRGERDIPMSYLGLGIVATIILFTIFFHLTFAENLAQTIIAFFIVSILSILLSVVGISSIAFTGNEPVSGMTIFMILVAGVALTASGMGGQLGMLAVLMMAAFLCTTIGVAGNFMSEMKVAHMTGATPAKMQQWQLVSIVLTGIVSVGVVMLLNHAYGFVGDGALNAPQANAMAAIVEPLMNGMDAPWPLYMAGAFLAIIMWMVGVPPLAFALGVYLPMEINTPVLVGGLLSYFVAHSSKDETIKALRIAKGNTIASGLVAGGAIGALISAVLRIAGVNVFLTDWVKTPSATYIGLIAYLLLCLVVYKVALKVKK